MAKLTLYKNKALVLRGTEEEIKKASTVAPHDLINLAPDTIALPWTYDNAARLALMDLPTVSPVYKDYKWIGPGSFRPYQHQIRCVDFLSLRRRAYCFAGTGSGKTAVAIWAAHYLMTLGLVKKVLFVSPLSVLTDAWESGLGCLLFGVADYTIITGSPEKKARLVKENTPFHAINYEGVKGLHRELMENNYDLVVLDESTKVKNRETDIWMTCYPLVRKATYAWQMTGTPTAMGPMDAFGQACMFDRFGNRNVSKSWFENIVTFKYGPFKRIPVKNWQEIVAKYLQPAIRIRTRDCVDLPPLVTVQRHLPLTAVQNAAIKVLRTQEAVNLAGRNVEGSNTAILLNKVVQIACGAVLDEEGTVIEMKPTKRLNEMLEIIHGEEGKTIVFAPFRAAVNMIAKYLRGKGISVGIVHGGVAAAARQKIFDAFQKEDKKVIEVLVAVPSAMAHGVTLTEASHIIWYAPVTSTEVYLQANARMERNGQKRHMTVTEFWGEPREKQLYDLIAGRADGQLTLLDIYKKID